MISLKEYAEKHKIGYEAVRKQVARYETELEGHVSLQNRKRYLDQYAEDFLDTKRNQSPIVIFEESRREEVESMEAIISNLQAKLLEAQDKIISLQEERTGLLEYKAKNDFLMIESQKKDDAMQELRSLSETLYSKAIIAEEKEKAAQIRLKEQTERAEKSEAAVAAMRDEKENLERVAEASDREKEAIMAKLEAAEKEASSFERSIFGFYRKKH